MDKSYKRNSAGLITTTAALASLAIAASGLQAQAEQAKPPQYIAISFDGSKNIDAWKESRAAAEKYDAKFTYFISCVYFLSRENRKLYKPPHLSAGKSNIGFARTSEDILERLNQVNLAMDEKHEIGSHACGHYKGREWSKRAWTKEFDAFDRIMRNAYKNNGHADAEPEDWAERIKTAVKGFRAPFLATNPSLIEMMGERGFTYDASRISGWHKPRVQHKNGVWNFKLALIQEGGRKGRIVSMDYNFYIRHSGGKPRPEKKKEFRRRMFDAYMDYFDNVYNGKRQPMHIGHHFTRWNSGAYWNALFDFVAKVCPRKDVKCITYSELVKIAEKQKKLTKLAKNETKE